MSTTEITEGTEGLESVEDCSHLRGAGFQPALVAQISARYRRASPNRRDYSIGSKRCADVFSK